MPFSTLQPKPRHGQNRIERGKGASSWRILSQAMHIVLSNELERPRDVQLMHEAKLGPTSPKTIKWCCTCMDTQYRTLRFLAFLSYAGKQGLQMGPYHGEEERREKEIAVDCQPIGQAKAGAGAEGNHHNHRQNHHHLWPRVQQRVVKCGTCKAYRQQYNCMHCKDAVLQ